MDVQENTLPFTDAVDWIEESSRQAGVIKFLEDSLSRKDVLNEKLEVKANIMEKESTIKFLEERLSRKDELIEKLEAKARQDEVNIREKETALKKMKCDLQSLEDTINSNNHKYRRLREDYESVLGSLRRAERRENEERARKRKAQRDMEIQEETIKRIRFEEEERVKIRKELENREKNNT